MFLTWFLTVLSEMNSSFAMSRLFIPRATRRSTSISRSVSLGAGTRCGCSVSSFLARAANSVSSLPAIDGLISDWPPCTARTAADLIQRDVLEQVAARASLDGLEQVLFLVAHRQDDDLRARGGLLDRAARLDAAAPRHPDVHEHDIGQGLACLRHRLGPVARLADDLDVGLAHQHDLQAAAEQRVIIDDQRADRLGAGPGHAARLRAR